MDEHTRLMVMKEIRKDQMLLICYHISHLGSKELIYIDHKVSQLEVTDFFLENLSSNLYFLLHHLFSIHPFQLRASSKLCSNLHVIHQEDNLETLEYHAVDNRKTKLIRKYHCLKTLNCSFELKRRNNLIRTIP